MYMLTAVVCPVLTQYSTLQYTTGCTPGSRQAGDRVKRPDRGEPGLSGTGWDCRALYSKYTSLGTPTQTKRVGKESL